MFDILTFLKHIACSISLSDTKYIQVDQYLNTYHMSTLFVW